MLDVLSYLGVAYLLTGATLALLPTVNVLVNPAAYREVVAEIKHEAPEEWVPSRALLVPLAFALITLAWPWTLGVIVKLTRS